MITKQDIARELRSLLKSRELKPAGRTRHRGEHVTVEVFARQRLRLDVGIGDLVVQLRAHGPLESMGEEFLKADREVCRELSSDQNPGAAEAAKERLELLEDQERHFAADALEGHEFEFQQAKFPNPVSERTDSHGRAELRNVFIHQPGTLEFVALSVMEIDPVKASALTYAELSEDELELAAATAERADDDEYEGWSDPAWTCAIERLSRPLKKAGEVATGEIVEIAAAIGTLFSGIPCVGSGSRFGGAEQTSEDAGASNLIDRWDQALREAVDSGHPQPSLNFEASGVFLRFVKTPQHDWVLLASSEEDFVPQPFDLMAYDDAREVARFSSDVSELELHRVAGLDEPITRLAVELHPTST